MNSSKPFERSFTLDKIYIHGNDILGLYCISLTTYKSKSNCSSFIKLFRSMKICKEFWDLLYRTIRNFYNKVNFYFKSSKINYEENILN